MKPLHICIAICSFYLLSGCTFFSSSEQIEDRVIEENTQENSEVTYQGIVTPKDISRFEFGTHLLEKDNGENIAIQSKVITLNAYIDNSVEIQGTKLNKAGQTVIDVTEINVLEDNIENYTIKKYNNEKLGIGFNYPSNVKITKTGNTISVKRKNISFLEIQRINNEIPTINNAEPFTISNDIQGTRVNKDSGDIIMYIENKQNHVKVSFFDDENRIKNKGIFYDILNSMYINDPILLEKEIAGECGGEEKLRCEEGYYCELSSSEENALGSCVKTGRDTPEIYETPEELEVDDLDTDTSENSETETKINDPATSFINDDNDESPNDFFENEDGKTGSEDIPRLVKEYIDENFRDELKIEDLDSSNIQLDSYEFSPPDIVSVVYSDGEEKRKMTFTYSVDNFNILLNEEAYFVEGETTDWELSDGRNIQSGKEKTVVKDNQIVEVNEGYTLYSNSRYEFNTQYPSNWYFAGLGAKGTSIYSVGFGPESIERGNQVVEIQIHQGDISQADAEGFTVERDSETHFKIIGDSEYLDIIQIIAENITSL